MNTTLQTKYPHIFGDCSTDQKWHRREVKIPMTSGDTKAVVFVVNSRTGALYIGDDKWEIWAKMVGIALIRVHLTFMKFAYHAFLPLSMTCAIVQGLNESAGKPLSERILSVLTRSAQNLIDIVKTPLVGVVLTVLFAVGAIFGLPLMVTDFLYELRNVISPIIHFLWWNERIPEIGDCWPGPETLCMTAKYLVQEKSRPFESKNEINYPAHYLDDEKRFLHYALSQLPKPPGPVSEEPNACFA